MDADVQVAQSYSTLTSVRSVAGWPLTGSCCVKLSMTGAVRRASSDRMPSISMGRPVSQQGNLVLVAIDRGRFRFRPSRAARACEHAAGAIAGLAATTRRLARRTQHANTFAELEKKHRKLPQSHDVVGIRFADARFQPSCRRHFDVMDPAASSAWRRTATAIANVLSGSSSSIDCAETLPPLRCPSQ